MPGDGPDPPREPLIVDVKRNSLDDGPGIRSVVFFKGCPLRCVWCQNPEALSPRAELQRDAERCVACGACAIECPAGVARPAAEPQRGECRTCGACVAVCPSGARRIAGTAWPVDDLVDRLMRDEAFYRASGGGATFSGGEPSMHAEFAGAVAEKLSERGVRVLVETCGDFDWDRFSRRLLPHVAAVWFDVKIADPAAHRRHTGRDNARILDNLDRIVETAPDKLLCRVPLIPGVTDGEENLAAVAELLRTRGIDRVAVLPYNPLWIPKRRALGLDLPYARSEWMPQADVQRCREMLRSAGLIVAG